MPASTLKVGGDSRSVVGCKPLPPQTDVRKRIVNRLDAQRGAVAIDQYVLHLLDDQTRTFCLDLVTACKQIVEEEFDADAS